MSRYTESAKPAQIDKDGNIIDCPTKFHHGLDHAIGNFLDITDERFAGTKNDPQGEGYLFEWNQRWGISTNLIDAKNDDINNKEKLLELVEEFITKMKLNDS